MKLPLVLQIVTNTQKNTSPNCIYRAGDEHLTPYFGTVSCQALMQVSTFFPLPLCTTGRIMCPGYSHCNSRGAEPSSTLHTTSKKSLTAAPVLTGVRSSSPLISPSHATLAPHDNPWQKLQHSSASLMELEEPSAQTTKPG